jgi:hypothetical protein
MLRAINSPRRQSVAGLTAALVACATIAGWASAGSAASAAVPLSSREPTNPSSQTDPCTYVSAGQAASILRVSSVKVQDAPLGPTCIFKPKGAKTEVTLAVEVLRLSSEVHVMKHVTKLSISGHAAYCGTLGGALLLVALTPADVLVVSAPCTEARAFATTALRRIKT